MPVRLDLSTLIRALFDGYNMHSITNRREINLNSENRDISELLITNYG